MRGRNENVFNSSSLRLERQKQFLTTFIAQAKNQAITNPSIAVDLYNTISKYMVIQTLTLRNLHTSLLRLWDTTLISAICTPCRDETLMGDKYEEFYVDDDALYQLIIDVFYEPVESEDIK